MKLLKPSWVSHNGKPIFSVDIHPDGTKFATGGQGEDSGKVMIWNMAPVLREEDEKNENISKMLCQMDNHLACVNCVRWSNNGLYLASGGDDKLVMVWKRAAFIGPSTVFGSSSKLANVEQWRCVTILRNHTGDVMDVAWSPRDVWLASCSVDNTIVIWNARKFPEMITTLRGHTGLVKGLTWDPVGKYIASQADDHSLKVWRTVDWQMDANITKPFSECGGTTHVLRLSWSPDGQYLVSAHAMNNSGPTAQIVERDGWKTNMDFVGHRKAVTVVKFNPKIFKKKQKNGSSPKPSCPYCCCAVGSKDRSLSVWLTSLKRPLVVIHDLFDKSIMDISWTLTGLGMLVCSMDGTVAYLDFSLDELGDPLNEEEKNSIHQNIYGKSLAITSTEAQLSTTIIENPEILKYQQERQNSAQANSGPGAAAPESSAPKLNSVMNGESLEDIRKNLLKKQVETRTADGRRRITPLCIAQLDTGDFSPALFNSVPILPSGSSMSSQLTPQLSSDSSPGQASSMGLKPTHDPMLTSPPPNNTANVKSSLLLTSASKIEPMKALDSRFTERSKATPGVTATASPLNSNSIQVSMEPSVFLEVENEVSMVAGSKLSQLRCSRDGRDWNTLLPSSVVVAAGSSDILAVACEDRMLSVFSSCGRRLLPAIQLGTPASALHCSAHYVMVLTAGATLSVHWTVQREIVLLQTLIADKSDSLVQCADFRSCLPSHDTPVSSGPLAVMQGRNLNAGRLASRLSSTPHHLQQSMTLAFLENQLASALTLQSAQEYRYWLLIYARFLVNEGSEYRLRELCKELLGPVHKSAATSWEPTTLGLRKRELLREVLPVIGENLRFQRLFTEYQDQLELLRNK
uniref:Protein HIRA n=1 Tax=Astatotilapia calliptera TaxID=8154 RepID=A0AAX7UUK3_ASTCA